MLKNIAAATSIIAILTGYALPGATQSVDTNPTQIPTPVPSTEALPVTPTTTPATPSDTLSPTTPPTETPSVSPTTPSTETQPSPSTPLPSIEPVTPAPSTSTPPTTPSAEVKPTDMTVKTMVLDQETISGVKQVSLPTPPTTPAFFTLPIKLRVVKDAAITSNTPITDKSASDLAAWASAIRACAMDKPAFVRVVGDEQVPFIINGTEGKVRLNANDKPVCGA